MWFSCTEPQHLGWDGGGVKDEVKVAEICR